jgi:U3 small nucleolar RNA-associated protein 24
MRLASELGEQQPQVKPHRRVQGKGATQKRTGPNVYAHRLLEKRDIAFAEHLTMGKAKKTRKFAEVKRMISPNDARLKENQKKVEDKKKKAAAAEVHHVDQTPSAMFFSHNEALAPPYHVIVDTNFINFAIKNKIDLMQGMMDCLYAKCIPCILDSVMAELEKMGTKFRIALRMAKDPRFLRLPSYLPKGHYADDDIVEHVKTHRCYIVATCDRDLKRRLRKVPGVPIMYISQRKFTIERMPEAFGAPL